MQNALKGLLGNNSANDHTYDPTCHPFRKSGGLTRRRTASSLPDAQKSDFLKKSDLSLREHVIAGKLGYICFSVSGKSK